MNNHDYSEISIFKSKDVEKFPASYLGFGCLLSDRSIKEFIDHNLLIEGMVNGEIKDEQYQPNSFDLTLSDSIAHLFPNAGNSNTGKINLVDTAKEIKCIDENKKFDKFYDVEPGEFLLMSSREILNIPNGIVGFVQGRSSIARLGIQTEQAGLIDAGFRGTITFEVYNQSKYTIRLYEGMRIAQVYFFKSELADRPYGSTEISKYNNQMTATGSKINNDKF